MWRCPGWKGWVDPTGDDDNFNAHEWPYLLPPKPPPRRGAADPHRFDLQLSGRKLSGKAGAPTQVLRLQPFFTDER